MKKNRLNNKFVCIIAGIVIVILAFLAWKYEVWKLISIGYLRRFTGRIRGLGYLGIFLYLLSFVLGTMLFLPSLPFILLGGITYGTVLGIIFASIGDLLGATMAFLVARYIMRDRIEKILNKNKTFHEINEGVKHDGWRIVVLTRMVPVIPHWLQNYAYGITEISFKIYALVSLLCIVPATVVWIIAINTVGRGEGDAKKTMIYLAITAVVIVVISYLPKLLYKNKILGNKRN